MLYPLDMARTYSLTNFWFFQMCLVEPGYSAVCDGLRKELKDRFRFIMDASDPIYVAATALDPRFRFILDDLQLLAAKVEILKLVSKFCNRISITTIVFFSRSDFHQRPINRHFQSIRHVSKRLNAKTTAVSNSLLRLSNSGKRRSKPLLRIQRQKKLKDISKRSMRCQKMLIHWHFGPIMLDNILVFQKLLWKF